MRRTPIACGLEEAGEWLPWKERYRLSAPIRLYANGDVEDDIFAASTKWWTKRRRPKRYTRLGVKRIRRIMSGKVYQAMPYSLLYIAD